MKMLFWFDVVIGCVPDRLCLILLYDCGKNCIFVDSSFFHKEELSLQGSLMCFYLTMSRHKHGTFNAFRVFSFLLEIELISSQLLLKMLIFLFGE